MTLPLWRPRGWGLLSNKDGVSAVLGIVVGIELRHLGPAPQALLASMRVTRQPPEMPRPQPSCAGRRAREVATSSRLGRTHLDGAGAQRGPRGLRAPSRVTLRTTRGGGTVTSEQPHQPEIYASTHSLLRHLAARRCADTTPARAGSRRCRSDRSRADRGMAPLGGASRHHRTDQRRPLQHHRSRSGRRR